MVPVGSVETEARRGAIVATTADRRAARELVRRYSSENMIACLVAMTLPRISRRSCATMAANRVR